MSTKILDKAGLEYLWTKLKAYFAPKAHTHNAFETKHSYTVAANAAKNWYRIANANTHQMDTSKPLHVQFLLSAWNPDQPADYYEQWFIDCQVFGRNSGIRIFGASGAPFSQARVLYENTVADIDTNDRPAIDIYLNYVLATACHVEIQEVYNSGWTFLADGVLAASTIPTGFENRAVGSQGSGVHQATYANYGTYTTLQRSNITANITLADNDTYRMRVLNCTNAITVTVPSLNSAYAWFLIKNFNTVSTNKNVTIHPSTTSVLIDDSNADIVLKPGEWVVIASKAANSYTLIGDSRWKSQKADKATTLAGYGITDAKIANGTITLGSNSITPLTSHQALPTLSKTSSGSGNAVTDISVSNHAITVTKGSTFLTSHQSLADYAKLASPAFTGTPTAPTAAASTNNTQIATTAFVKAQGYLTSHQTLPSLSLTTSGSGNAITALSVNGHAITATKGATYITSSGSITGNAGTATKFASAQSVALTGAVTGTASSQAGWSVGTVWRSCMVGQSGPTTTNPWYKVATFAVTEAYDDIIATFLVEDTYSSHNQGILKVHVRTEGDKVISSTASDLIWLSHTGFTLADFVLVCPTTASSTVELWTKITAGYMFRRFTVLSEGSRVSTSIRWTLLNASSAGQAANITTTGTQIASTLAGQAASCSGNAATVTGTAGTSALSWNTETTLYTVGGHAVKAKLPANPNSNWTSHLYAGASNGNANAATTNGNTYLIICDNRTARDRRLIKGTGATTVTSDANGVITIHSTDNNTTYSAATQSAAGLMSAADKKKLDGIETGAGNIPVGAIIYYAKSTVPSNFLICNGGAVSRTTYATLFGVIGTTFGKGNGSSTFNVPNLIGRFPEGNATPGTVHNAGLPNITGGVNEVIMGELQFDGALKKNAQSVGNLIYQANAGFYRVALGFDASESNAIYGKSSTVQPPALTLVPCIRYV